MNKALSIFGEALTALGTDMAKAAATQVREENDYFNRAKTLLSLAQSVGVGREAHEALYEPGEKMVARKTLWFRRQKRLFGLALNFDIPIRSDATQKQLSDAVYEKRESLKSDEVRQEDALRMFQRTAKGALQAKVDGGTMARTLLTQAGKTYTNH